jgi:transposase
MQDPAAREQWAKRVERWKDSGLSAKEFAAETGINANSLSWWRWQLSKGTEVPEPRRRRRSRTATGAIAQPPPLSPMTFVEMTAPASLDKLEVVLASTIRVCVRPGFDAVTLGRLLDVLEQRR